MPATIKLRVKKISGYCAYGFEEGQEFLLNGLATPKEGFCGGAYHAIFPYLSMLNFGGKLPTGNIINGTCADGGKVTFEIETKVNEKEVKEESQVMDQMNVFEGLKVIFKKMGFREDEIKPESNLSMDMEFDSTESVEAILYIEKAFGVTVNSDDIKNNTIQDLMDAIQMKVEA